MREPDYTQSLYGWILYLRAKQNELSYAWLYVVQFYVNLTKLPQKRLF